MKQIYIIAIILISAGTNSLFAQQKIDPTVEVKRDFESTLIEINKSPLNTKINDSLNNLNLDFNYTIFEKPYRDMYEFNPLPSLKLENHSSAANPYLFAKVSAGYPFNPNAEIYFQPFANSLKLSNKHKLVVNAYYKAFMGKLPIQEYSSISNEITNTNNKTVANNSKIGISASYTHIWRGGELNTGVEFYNKSNLFYGINSSELSNINNYNASYLKDSSSRSYNNFIVFFNIKSYMAKENGNRFNYNFNLSYQNTSDKIYLNRESYNNGYNGSKYGDNLISFNGEFGPTVGKYNKFLIGVNTQASFGYYSNYNNIGFIEFTPQYKYENGNLLLNIGANIAIPFNNTESNKKYHSIITPQVNLSIKLADEKLWFYTLLEGENRLNNYSSLLELNNWYIPQDTTTMSSTPYALQVGLKGKIVENISYNIYAGYARRMGLLQFITPIEGESFTTAYSTHNNLFIGADINIKTESFNGGINLKYNHYSKGINATNLPDDYLPLGYAPFECLLFAQYTIKERITIGTEIDYRSKTPTLISNASNIDQPYINSFLNLNLYGNYSINNTLGLYAKIGNILNSNIQYLPFYLEQGINFTVGASIKF